MDSETRPLHVVFFPFMAHGHMIPTVDMAKLFASRGVQSTIITTAVNKTLISKSVDKARSSGLNIDVKTIPFPALEVGLPDGCENIDMIHSPELFFPFFQAAELLREAFEELLEEARPDCLISDLVFSWSVDSAAKIGIPRLVFLGTSFFAMCVIETMRVHKPYKAVSSDEEPFLLPNLPGGIKLTQAQFPVAGLEDIDDSLGKIFRDAFEAEARSYGMLVNSFYELESAYADHYRNVMKRRAWHIGPVSICNRDFQEKAARGKPAAVNEHECLSWLESKKANSVIYVCFGSSGMFPDPQLCDIALGLEASGQNFIWVIRRSSKSNNQDYLPEGFLERVKDRGLLIRGWAPQVLILDHASVGAFVTHCGWNSTLEGISAGLPMATWPLIAEQFCTEKLITDMLKIGIRVGVEKCSGYGSGPSHVEKVMLEKAVRRIIDGKDADEMRNRAQELGKMAKRAVEKDGSSYADLNSLLTELKSKRGH